LLEVIEIIRKIEQGRTEPYLCVGSDGKQYVVKGNTTLGKGRIVEYICAHIGKAFGLPIPDCCIIYTPDDLLDDTPKVRSDIGCGFAFASLFIPQLQEVNLSIINKFDRSLLKDIFLFDYWIQNEDRTLGKNGFGNPNLIFRPVNKKLFVLDHNLAFDVDYTIKDMKKSHACRDYWFEKQRDLLNINEYKDRMNTALTDLDVVISKLPDEWFTCATVKDDLIDNITVQLKSYTEQEFWEPLL